VRPTLQNLEKEKNQTPLDARFAILNRDHKNIRQHSILKKVCFLAAVIHIVFIFFFLSIGSLWLSVFNVFSVVIWLIAIIHAVMTTHFLGLSMGFQYFLWPVALLVMVSNSFITQRSTVMGFAVILLYGALSIYAKDISYQYAFPVLADFVLIINIFFAALAFVIVVMNSQDKNEQNEQNEQYLYEISNKDKLTGAFNRQFVYDLMKQTYSERRGFKALDYTLVLTDIDNFKEINESLGHIAGDAVIKQVATYLQSAVRETDIVARWGGEEFLIVLMNIESDDSQTLIEKVRDNIRYQVTIEGLSDRLTTLSFGVAKAKEDEQFEDTIRRDLVNQLTFLLN
jgi:diguanylate cyclase (GGDEF)-like protein